MTSLRSITPRLGILLSLAHWPTGPLAAQLPEGGPAIGAPAPTVVTTDLDGRRVDLATWIGKRPVLLEFWATWCVPCQDLMPKMDSAHAEFGDRVTFLGVNVAMNETVAGVRAWVGTHRPGFQVLYDSAATAIRAYDVQATSTVIIIDAAGKVAYAGVGASQDLRAALRKLFVSDPVPGSD